MMQRRYSRQEQERARGVNLALFLTDYDIAHGTKRFSVDKNGYIHDTDNEYWRGSVKQNWWYNNNPTGYVTNGSGYVKNGNVIDWLMYLSDEKYSFPNAMNILLAYADGNDWIQYMMPETKTELEYDENGCPFN